MLLRSLLCFLALSGAARAQSPERLTGPVPEEVEAWKATVARYESRGEEFKVDAWAIVDQAQREEQEKISFAYESSIEELDVQQDALRAEAIRRLEAYLAKYPSSSHTPLVMFRLAELYFEDASVNLQNEDERYRALQANMPPDVEPCYGMPTDLPWQNCVPSEPRLDLGRSLAMYQRIVKEFPDFKYADGAYYMIGYCYSAERSVQHNDADGDGMADDAQGEMDLWQKYTSEAYETLIARFPDSEFAIAAYFTLGDLAFQNFKTKKAIEYFATMVQKAPKEHELYDNGVYMLAWSRYREDDFREAMRLFTDLLDFSEVVKRESGKDAPTRPEALRYSAITITDVANDAVFIEVDPRTGDPPPTWLATAPADQLEAVAFLEMIGLPPVRIENGQRRAYSAVEIAEAYYAMQVKQRQAANVPVPEGGLAYEHDLYVMLAEVLLEQAAFEDAVATYAFLQERWPYHPDNPEYQWQVSRIYLISIGDQVASDTAVKELTEKYRIDGSWWVANDDNPDAQAVAKRYIEQSLLRVAKEFHKKAQETTDADEALKLYSQAADRYREYMQRFPFADNYYETQWYLADCLFNARRYDEALKQYEEILKGGTTEYRDGSVYNSVICLMEMVKARYGSVEQVPADATVERTVELAGGGQRQVYLVSDLHKRFMAAAEAISGETLDGDYGKALDENRKAFTYLPAYVYYTHGNYEEAKPRMEKVNQLYTCTDEGAFARGAIYEMYKADGDLENMFRVSKLYGEMERACGNVDLAGTDWGSLQENTAFNLCSKKKAAGDFLGAAECFGTFMADYPKSANRAAALYNSANNYEAAGKSEKANALYEQFIQQYPSEDLNQDGTPEARDYYWRIAQNYAAVLDFDKAIAYYEKLETQFGRSNARYRNDPHPDADDALYMAGFLRVGKGDHKGAAENFEQYAKMYPEAADAEMVLWAAGEQWKLVSPEKAFSFYSRYLSNPLRTPDHAVEAQYWIVQYYEGKKDRKNADKAWVALLALYGEFEAKGVGMGPLARNYAAEAEFRKLWTMYQDYLGDAYPKKDEDLITFLKVDKVNEYLAIQDEATLIITRFQDFEYTTAALYVWGSTYFAYADYVEKCPLPQELQKAQKANPDLANDFESQFRDQLYQVLHVEEVKAKGYARYTTNLDKSRQEKRSSKWIDETIKALNTLDPSTYPLEKEEARGSTDSSLIPRSGPKEQPAPEKEAK